MAARAAAISRSFASFATLMRARCACNADRQPSHRLGYDRKRVILLRSSTTSPTGGVSPHIVFLAVDASTAWIVGTAGLRE